MEQKTRTFISNFIKQHLAVQPAGGISIAITDMNKTIFSRAFGFANLQAQTKLTIDHLMQIGSIGKSFTALALMQLYEEGKFDPRSPVTEYLPWLVIPNRDSVVACHHLLTHTAGIPQGTDEGITAKAEAWALRNSHAIRPGKYFHYSNTGYKVLGLVLEALTDASYADIVRKKILQPLGMSSTMPVITNDSFQHHATGYQPFPPDKPISNPFLDKSRLAPAPWLETNTADGSITSTPEDMAIYIRALLNGFSQLIRPETYETMTGQHILETNDPQPAYYGYGLNIFEFDGRRYISHSGGMLGYTSQMICAPEDGFGVIVLMNGPGGAHQVAQVALSAVIAEKLSEPLPEIPASRDHYTIQNGDDFTGDYIGMNAVLTIEKRSSGLGIKGISANLSLRAEDTFHLDRRGWDKFFIRLRRNEAGEVEALVHGEEVYYRAITPPEVKGHPDFWNAFPGEYISHNPWYPGFRILLREGRLYLTQYSENEDTMDEIEPGFFQIGGEGSPETVRFEDILDGRALRAVYSGANYYRRQ